MPVAEHLKHPHQRPAAGVALRHIGTRAAAAAYGETLRVRTRAFARGEGPIPPELFYYPLNRSAAVLARVRSRLLRPDSPGRVCGRPARNPRRRVGPTAPPAPES